MLNFITQQRRGSTEEWSKSTEIPRAGEFVIEEIKDGHIRIKIGDGVHLFKDLKYIDQETVSALTDLESRYNAHVAYVEGGSPVPDSTLATEVLDARYIDGTSYSSLNQAIQSVSDKRVGGMVYDYTGELGIRQPYMLYLTDKDNNIIEETGVRIISGGGGGGGGSSTSVLKIGYITTSPLVVTLKDSAILKFTFSGTDSSGDTILQASSTWKVDGKTVSYGTVKDGENEFDVTKYLKIGTSKILLTVVDDSGSVVTKNWSVQQVDIKVESDFDDKITYPLDDIIFTYTPYGAVDKVVHISMDGKEIATIDSPAKLSGNVSRYELPKQSHGAHLVDVYVECTINDNLITSNHVFKDILWYDSTNNTAPVIGTVTQKFTSKQYDITNIEYTVYDPSSETPEVNIFVDNELVSTVILSKPTNTFAYTTSEIGTHTIKIQCGETIKDIVGTIEKLDIDVNPVTVGLAFDFNPVGRSNSDINRLWSDNNVHMTVSENFDWINGGYKQDSNGDTYFCIKSGTTATIDYNLFGDDAKKSGKEMKLIFKTENVSNPDAVFMSCVDNTTDTDHIGISMRAHSANIYGQNGNLELEYSENDIIEFEFNISSATEIVPMIMGYEDGVATRPLVYDTTYSFKQNTVKPIVFGSIDCDVHVYRMKVYNTSLTNIDILNNFISDARNTNEMRARYNRNQIYDENQNLTAEILAERCPDLRIYKISAPHFTNNKSDKVDDTTIQQIYKGGDPVLDNWTAYNAQHSGQGTSSNNYGAAGRNLDFIMNKTSSYFELGDGTTTDENGDLIKTITLTRSSVPVAYLNAKVNIASSNNLTNAILAKRYNQFNPYRRPFVRSEDVNTEYIKDTMEFYNCVIFIQESDPDLTTHREFADTDWHFYAIGNIGDSKKTDNTRTTDPDDPYECCVEIMDVGLPLSAFPRDTMIDAMSYSVDDKTGEKIYKWATDDNLGILYEKQEDGTYVLTSDTSVDLTKTYYVDILVNDDFSEDYTYGWRYLTDEDNPDVFNFCKQRWIEFYRFVTTSTDEQFKENLKNYFVIDSALYYYLFTTRYCMVDNRAKNTFWHYSKTADGTRKWDLCWDYDNDTSLGLNNYGKQVYRYGLEDIDKDTSGQEIFRQSDSTFFCRIRDLFEPQLKEMYKELESKNAWKAETFINEADAWQNQFPEELWRIDIDRKYIRTYTSSFIDGKGDSQFLSNMCNGKMKYHRRQWERSQEQYMASKFQTITASGDNYHANFRFGKPATENPVIEPNYQLTLTPYSYIYLNVQYGGTTPISVRAVPNVETVVPYYGKDADIVNVYSAAAIRDFGDLSSCYPITASIGNASRVKKLKLGNDKEGYNNSVFTTLTTGANPLLEEVNIENVSSIKGSLNLSALINLKTLYAFGTSITSALFADGGKIEHVELPPVNSLEFKNLLYLETDNIILQNGNYDTVVDLTVEGCPRVDSMTLLSKCKNVKRVRLLDVNIENATYDYFRDNIFHLKGINGAGEETPDAWITGTAKFDTLQGSEYNELRAKYPELNIYFKQLDCTVTFRDSNEDWLYEVKVSGTNNIFPSVADPVESGNITSVPTKEETAKYYYTFAGWSTVNDGKIPEMSPLDSVSNDLTVYPAFDETLRSYNVSYYNNDNTLLYVESVLYGDYPSYDGVPTKAETSDPTAFKFNSWVPSQDTVVTGARSCYATYSVDLDKLYELTISDVSYEIQEDNSLKITEYTGDKTLIKIPQLLTDTTGISRSVTNINGFNNNDIEYVVIPEGVSIIGPDCFKNNSKITNINVPKSVVEIHEGAFANCKHISEIRYDAVNAMVVMSKTDSDTPLYNTQNTTGYSVIVGAYVESIPDNMFNTKVNQTGVYSVKTLTFEDNSVCKTIGKESFRYSGCSYVIFPNELKEIKANAFEYSTFEHLELPEKIESIGNYAFAYNKQLTYVDIPASVKFIDSTTFYDCPEIDFNIEEGSRFVWQSYCLVDTKDSRGPTVLMGSGHKDTVIPDNLAIAVIDEYAFYNKNNIESVIIPETVKTLESYAFYGCSNLKTIKLSENLKTLNQFALYGCPISELSLPTKSLQQIGSYAICNNTAIERLVVPSCVTSIGYKAFQNCPELAFADIQSSNVTMLKPNNSNYNLFVGCEKLNYIKVNWNSDGTKIDSENNNVSYVAINDSAPWSAGTDSENNQLVDVTVNFNGTEVVYIKKTIQNQG